MWARRFVGLKVEQSDPHTSQRETVPRQKGIFHLIRAIRHMTPGIQVVLCAGAPDTPMIDAEMRAAVAEAQAKHPGVVWINEMIGNEEKIELYSHAGVFCCPSIYEPFGIINLEAMACGTAVVATATGGIKEVVVHGETGYLVPIDQMNESPFEAKDPEQFSRDLAERINEVMADTGLRTRMAKAGRLRAEKHFAWSSIARRTADLYETLLQRRR